MIVETMLLAGLLGQTPSRAAREAPGAENKVAAASTRLDSEADARAGVANPTSTANDGYRIGPEDVLTIDVWKETDLSASTPVRPDGKISVPLLNDVQAAGLTPVQLAANLREQLSRYLIDPKITVSVAQMNSRKAYVMGLVNRQGIVRLQSELTVLQAISAAGGLAPFANAKKIYILRTENGNEIKLPFDYNAVIKGKHPEQNIVLRPGDTVVIP
jgi:polysaccharide export outer membrane protein